MAVPEPPPGGLSRRAFARALAAGGAASLALATGGLPVSGQSLPAAAQPEAEATTARILARYGSRLTPAQKARIPRLVASHLEMLAPIRALAQPNSAPPAAVLRLVTGGEDKKQ